MRLFRWFCRVIECSVLSAKITIERLHMNALLERQDRILHLCQRANGEATRRPKVSKNLEDAPLSMKES